MHINAILPPCYNALPRIAGIALAEAKTCGLIPESAEGKIIASKCG
jgi:hypothetical protein